MSATASWLDQEKNVTTFTISGEWTVHQILEAAQKWRDMLTEVNDPVYNVMDFSSAVGIPADFLPSFPVIARNLTHPNYSGGVVVVRDRLLKRFLEAYASVYEEYTYATTIEDAMRMIREKQVLESIKTV